MKILEVIRKNSKKYFLVFMILFFLCVNIFFSYSSFITSSNNHRTNEMYMNKIEYSIKINNNLINTISLPIGESTLEVEIQSLVNIETYYKLAYINNELLSIKYLSNSDASSGTIASNGIKNISLEVTNSGSTSLQLSLIAFGGYLTNSLEGIIIPSTYTFISQLSTPKDIKTNINYISSSANSEIDNYFLMKNSSCNYGNVFYNTTSNIVTFQNYQTSVKCTVNLKNKPLLTEVAKVGDYVSYTGTNGCPIGYSGNWGASSSNSCSGENANQFIDEANFPSGYCFSEAYKFTTTGWRIAYQLDSDSDGDDEAYIVSAGAPQCVSEKMPFDETVITTYNVGNITSYYYGSSYTYNPKNGTYSISGTKKYGKWNTSTICTSSTCPVKNYYTAFSTSSSAGHSKMYKIASRNSSTVANIYSLKFDPKTIEDTLNTEAIKYCNPLYAYGGNCQTTYANSGANTWALNGIDFYNMTNQLFGEGRRLYGFGSDAIPPTEMPTGETCFLVYGKKECGYINDLFDNGGYYWFASSYDETKSLIFNEYYRAITHTFSNNAYGLRPIVHLKSEIYVTGGSGTMSDPYTISVE